MGSLPLGRTRRLGHGRRFIADVMHFCRGVPFVAVERRVRIPDVAAARLAADPRPGWLAVFLKAFGLAAGEVPALRTSLLTFPWPRLYEHACTVAGVTVERDYQSEPTVFILQVRRPENTPLADIDTQIKKAKVAPVWDVPAFRRLIKVGWLPRPARRFVWWLGLRVSGDWKQKYYGTLTAGNTVNDGAEITHAVCPMSCYFTFGGVGDDGTVTLRLFFDHRVLDAAPAARGLAAMERALNGVILDELRGLAPS